VDSRRRRFDVRERIVDPAWGQPHIAAINKAESFRRIEVAEFGIVAPYQDR
jgi:hypothetical protein